MINRELGLFVTVLGSDMLTIEEEPVRVVPGCEYSEGTGFEGHAFFEASSIRKRGNTYYFIYSSEVMHELCYAVSDNPVSGFTYQGVIVSNCDLGIDSYKKGRPSCGLWRKQSRKYGADRRGLVHFFIIVTQMVPGIADKAVRNFLRLMIKGILNRPKLRLVA